MADIYTDQHCELNELLLRAKDDQGATLLIPDLQRPYVWSPRQVTLLVDSLIRGWPFGTFLTWKVKKDDPVRELARPFWKVVDRTDGGAAEQVSKKNPPASFQMVLDGQQRIQSVLLAMYGDSWGFKLYDRDWNIILTDVRPRGRQGVKHWSLGCLCIDLDSLISSYAETRRVAVLDFTNILRWVVTGGAQAQSQFEKKQNYQEPLPRTHDDESKGRYIRLSRMWEAAPTVEGIEQEQAEAFADKLLKEHDTPSKALSEALRPVGSLLLTLARVKKTRVTYLELAEFDDKIAPRETYNDAVVNIFTRLNTAGRTLTREDITFAWLKVGWIPARTANQGAAECFDDLADALRTQQLDLNVEDLVAGVSVVWSGFHADGRVLTNNDLLKGDAIRPMAADLSNNWKVLASAVEKASASLADRGYRYREHYESLNSVFILWAWQYVAEQWLATHACNTVEKDDYEKKISATLAKFIDRWLMASQWAGRWAAGSAETVAGYIKRLSEVAKTVSAADTLQKAAEALKDFLESETKALERDAAVGIQGIQASRRQLVGVYYAPLWIWHRLNADRWKMSAIPLHAGKKKKVNLDVDHSIAYALWEKKIANALPKGTATKEEALTVVNQMGNCSLLEKTFNISKSDKTLRSFLEQVHEFKNDPKLLSEWSAALALTDCMLDPEAQGVDTDMLVDAVNERDKLIREDLIAFVRGERARADLSIG